jgi:hypothetical protein
MDLNKEVLKLLKEDIQDGKLVVQQVIASRPGEMVERPDAGWLEYEPGNQIYVQIVLEAKAARSKETEKKTKEA